MKIDGQIFMGSGDHSLIAMGHLHSELERAFRLLSGIQQPPRSLSFSDSKRDERECEEGQNDIDMIASEIFLALTGLTINRHMFHTTYKKEKSGETPKRNYQ